MFGYSSLHDAQLRDKIKSNNEKKPSLNKEGWLSFGGCLNDGGDYCALSILVHAQRWLLPCLLLIYYSIRQCRYILIDDMFQGRQGKHSTRITPKKPCFHGFFKK